MLSELKRRTLAYNDLAFFERRPEKVLHHDESLVGRDDLRLRVSLHEVHDIGGVVRLHVLDDQIIGLSAV